jgi:hypothetical protein
MAVMLAAALAPSALLLSRVPALWSVPVLAPALAALGAGPGFAAFAGQASTWGRRAALGALGFLWVGLAEAAIRHPLLFGLAESQQERGRWMHDGWRALAHGVFPLLESPLLLCAAAWAAFAAVLPLFVRGERLAVDLMGAALWATGLAAAVTGVARLADPGSHPRGALVGAALAALVAVVFAGARRGRSPQGVEPVPVP